MTYFPANFATKTCAIEKKDAFSREKTFATEEKWGENTIFYSFSVLLTVTMTTDKVLQPKRLKIGVIKEQQRKNLKKRKKTG